MARTIVEPGKTIGIIGGGQLGRMMALAAKEAGFRIAVLEPSEGAPCAQTADIVIQAPYNDQAALKQLADVSDVITYEFENIDYDGLKELMTKANIPQGAELIRITQNRVFEKEALTKAGVKVAPYKVIRTEEELKAGISEIGLPAVLKTATGGYDGKGQFVLKEAEQASEAAALLQHGDCVLEQWLSFEKEISVIVTRNPEGETTYFPPAENIHINNILHESIVPARILPETEQAAKKAADQIASSLSLVGTLAVEMFVTEDGGIFINELAPRPHNSGHYTIEACGISQFGQHIRAVCNWPLKSTGLLKPAVMVNVLGQHVEGVIQAISEKPEWSIHLYGKEEAKHQRKMGHVTILTDNIEETLQEIEDSGIWTN
ncbi:5-(carboxyamino)imidazole ribonucleotide synthase [Domibacillus enclensis]|uniref:N5-carboxyaminoimidazole ribonucleotide synthase n=1 Tax=Domibacillus enclensis TaxID=1017273 RepID=A0A1N6W5X8_9BACI|nr:5-(carboxyamino)imidazole ribonucleotide synthase [Domibacillus enclensis]OXS77853.1 5-(carboxyamino)imidazole ribonucleotide synthase [Domibacillus enclensis]SIQ85366.1 5-(carboxyamino)imidazole ribonucleotide synthase [Domibacillus enclensis]